MLIFLRRAQVDLARAEIDRRQDLHAELVPDHLLELGADRAGEGLLQVVGVAEQIGGGQERPGRDLLGDVLRREIGHLDIAALHGDQLGALLEQRAVEKRLEIVAVLDGLAEGLERFGADVLLRGDGGEAELLLRLCLRGAGGTECNQRGSGSQHRTAGHCRTHALPPICGSL